MKKKIKIQINWIGILIIVAFVLFMLGEI